MANPEKGEVALPVGDRTYTLVLNTHALVLLQRLFKPPKGVTPLEEIYGLVNAGSVEHIVGLLWAALQKHHPEVTLEGAEMIIDQGGGIAGFASIFAEVNRAAAPDEHDLQELARANPPGADGARSRTRTRRPGRSATGISALGKSA